MRADLLLPEHFQAPLAAKYRAERVAHWDNLASSQRGWRLFARQYHRRVERVYKFIIPRWMRVLELGCAEGDLLASLEPSQGTGVDFSRGMVDVADRRHPDLQFLVADAHDLSVLSGSFDVIVLSDLLHDAWDVQGLLNGLKRICHPGTRLVMNFRSRLWELSLTA